ncbi:splicing regulator SDE2-like [Rhopilema esculentum]|uniref:splicing regulator SDE2-like n=1 Tax=Rhopilema esculentum TaxID=499914 RepID=UPI0031DDDD7A|eukprot:gene3124-1426_t
MDDENNCSTFTGKKCCRVFDTSGKGIEEMIKNLSAQDVYFTSNGKIFDIKTFLDGKIVEPSLVRCHLRILGGKGGFGSMLRALGAQIEKTTNREACRDLSGRRMRDVNNEKTINEWLEKKKTEDEDKAKRKKEKLEKILNPPRHILKDSSYVTDLKANAEKVEDALKQGLSTKQQSQGTGHGKRQNSSEKNGKAKKQRLWLGLDDSDTAEEDEDICDSTFETECLAYPVEKTDKLLSDVPNKSDSTDTKSDDPVHKKEVFETKLPEKDSEPDKEKVQISGHSAFSTKEEKPNVQTDNDSISDERSEKEDVSKAQNSHQSDLLINLQLFSMAEELEAFGLEKLKCELMKHGLKCGGTLQQRAQRLFLLKDTPIEKLDKSLFAKQGKKHSK